jgi:hypothetical protein
LREQKAQEMKEKARKEEEVRLKKEGEKEFTKLDKSRYIRERNERREKLIAGNELSININK